MNTRKLLTVTMLGIAGLLLASCAAPPIGSPSAKNRTIDPRFVGTWVGKYRHRDSTGVAIFHPDGSGMAYSRQPRQGRLIRSRFSWSTRQNILEQQWPVDYLSNLLNGTTSGGVSRENVTYLGSDKYTCLDLSNPKRGATYYKYSSQVTNDPFPAFAWYDNRGYKKSSR